MTAPHTRSRSFLVVAALAAALAAAATGASLGSSPATAASGEQTIVKTATQAGQFGTLLALAKRAGLVGELSGSGPLTLFAPTDAAFKAVPKATLDSLAKNRTALRRVLLYHVVKGNVPASRIVTLKSAKTLAGHDRDPIGRHERLPQRLDEGRQGRHRGDERHDPRHQQGAPPTGELIDPEARRRRRRLASGVGARPTDRSRVGVLTGRPSRDTPPLRARSTSRGGRGTRRHGSACRRTPGRS